jgi:hypothetical protein|tara:strand:+ start:537 stop:821 length:285 start_codon:yes stop_codon:yes gene_type:complete
MAEKTKKDACYHKVKARYKVWPSAYASGALSKCRKVGAANWGESSKKQKKAEGGLITAVDNPKRPARNRYKDGGIIASGCGCVEEERRKTTRTF